MVVQAFFSTAIVASFVSAILSVQLQPPNDSQLAKAFRSFEVLCIGIFCFVRTACEERERMRMKLQAGAGVEYA